MFAWYKLLQLVIPLCCACVQSLQSCLTLCHTMDHSLSGSSFHWILQARILEWTAMPSSRGSSWPRDRTHISWVSYIASRIYTAEPPGKPSNEWVSKSCSVESVSLWPCGLYPARFFCPRDSPGKNTGVDSHTLLQRIFPTQGLNPCCLCLLCWQACSSLLSHCGSLKQWVYTALL